MEVPKEVSSRLMLFASRDGSLNTAVLFYAVGVHSSDSLGLTK